MKAMIILIALSSPAIALDCASAPDRVPGLTWRYRVVDGARCWYRGSEALSRAALQWPAQAVNPDPPPAETVAAPLAKAVPTISYKLEDMSNPVFERQQTLRRTFAIVVGGVGITLILVAAFWPRLRRHSQTPI